MKLAIALYICILLSKARVHASQVIPRVEFPSDKTSVAQNQQDWVATIKSGAKHAATGMRHVADGLGYAKETTKAASKHLYKAGIAINSYYHDFMDAHGDTITTFLASVSQGLTDFAVLLSQKMGPLLINSRDPAVNVLWFESNKIFPSGRRGSAPVFSAVDQYEQAKASQAIKPIKVQKVDEDRYQTAADQKPIMILVRDPGSHVDPETGVERHAVFTSKTRSPQAFIIVNIENTGTGYEAIEQESFNRVVLSYVAMTTIDDKEVLVRIDAGRDAAPKSTPVSSPSKSPAAKAAEEQLETKTIGTKSQSSLKTQRSQKREKVMSKAPPKKGRNEAKAVNKAGTPGQKPTLKKTKRPKDRAKAPPGHSSGKLKAGRVKPRSTSKPKKRGKKDLKVILSSSKPSSPIKGVNNQSLEAHKKAQTNVRSSRIKQRTQVAKNTAGTRKKAN